MAEAKRKMSRREQQKLRKVEKICRRMPVVGGGIALIVGIVILIICLRTGQKVEPIVYAGEVFTDLNIKEEFLTVNEYSRPGIELEQVKKIVVHYTGNPGATAQGNRDYFESLAENPVTSASSHFIIGLDGEIIQCVPLNEVAYASNEANSYSISIECCHPTEDGEFTTATYNQCVALVAELCNYYHLNPENDVIRHYDVTGKECPRFYVDNPDEWNMFLGFVKERTETIKKQSRNNK